MTNQIKGLQGGELPAVMFPQGDLWICEICRHQTNRPKKSDCMGGIRYLCSQEGCSGTLKKIGSV